MNASDDSQPTDPNSPKSNSPKSNTTAAQSSQDQIDMDTALAELERSLTELKNRYAEITQAEQAMPDLRLALNAHERQLKKHRHDPELRAEIQRIKTEMERLEVILESHLLNWSSLRDLFWMAVRFGGLGIIIGWLLRSCAGS